MPRSRRQGVRWSRRASLKSGVSSLINFRFHTSDLQTKGTPPGRTMVQPCKSEVSSLSLKSDRSSGFTLQAEALYRGNNMMSIRRQPGPPLLWSLMAPLTVLAFGMGLQTGAPESSVPTAIEQALIEHRCRTTVAAGAPGSDAYQECPGVQLLSLRTDFGRDLSRLSAAERRSIDSISQQDPCVSGAGRLRRLPERPARVVEQSPEPFKARRIGSGAGARRHCSLRESGTAGEPGLVILLRSLDWRRADHHGRRGRRRVPGDEDSTFGAHVPSLRDERFRFR